MDLAALFTISHGVYLTGARDSNHRLIGSCIDAVMVVEASPAQILVSLNKQSYTAQTILKTKHFSLTVLPDDASLDLIQLFGMNTSRTTDKWSAGSYTLTDDLPIYNNAVAGLIVNVESVSETSGHYVLLCSVEQAIPGTMKKPLIYSDYQDKKRKEKTMSETKKWVCSVCGYVYDGEVPFEELPEDWVCPLCGEPKSVFVQE